MIFMWLNPSAKTPLLSQHTLHGTDTLQWPWFPHVCLQSRNYWGSWGAWGIWPRALNLTSKCSTSKYNLAAWDVSGKLGVLLTWECKLCLKQCLGGFIGCGKNHMNNRSQGFLLEYCRVAIIIISYLFIYLFSAFETKLKSASLSIQKY